MLFKNAFRTLKKRYLQLLLLGVIIILSSCIYAAFTYSIEGILGPTEKFFVETNQEDFSVGMVDSFKQTDIDYIQANCSASTQANLPFTLSSLKTVDEACYYGVINNRVDQIETVYPNLDIQVRESKTAIFTNTDKAYRVLFLKDLDRIDKSEITQGSRPSTDSEIAVSQTFAQKNDLNIGDTFTVKDKDYTISGFVLFPDYNLALFSQGLIIDNSSQTFALVTDQEFESRPELVSFEGAGVFLNGYNDGLFKTNVVNTLKDHGNLDFVTNMTLTANNMRSGGIYADIKSGQAMGLVMSLVIASIGLMIVGIMLSRVLHSQRGPIGILKSMGYTNDQIAKPFILLIAIMALPAILLGYFLGLWIAEPIKQMFLNFYLLPSKVIEQNFVTILIAVIVPFVFIVGLSFFIIRRLLNQKPVTLLNPEVYNSSNALTKRFGKLFKRFKITTKLQNLLLFRNIVKLAVYLFGMFFAAFLILLSFSMTGIFQRTLYDYYDKTNFNYIGTCNPLAVCDVPAGAEGVIQIPDASVNDEDLTLYGIAPDSELLPVYDSHDKEITADLSRGVIISKSAHLSDGFDIGDMLDINVGNSVMHVPVVGIAEEYLDKRVYIDIDELSKSLTGSTGYFNVVYSADELNSDNYMSVIKVQDIIDQSGAMNNFMNVFVYMMIGTSIIVGAIIIYILTVMTIEDNFYNISLFKVLGYNTKEINKIILGGYQLYGIAIFLLAVPVAIFSFQMLERLMASQFDVQFPIRFYWWQGLVAIVLYLVIFYIGAASAKRNLNKISLQEAMKMYEV